MLASTQTAASDAARYVLASPFFVEAPWCPTVSTHVRAPVLCCNGAPIAGISIDANDYPDKGGGFGLTSVGQRW